LSAVVVFDSRSSQRRENSFAPEIPGGTLVGLTAKHSSIMAEQGLSVRLGESPFLSFVSDNQVQKTLGLMGQPADAKLTPAIARELCQRTGSAAVVDGSIARIGTQYLLTLKAVDCKSRRSLASTAAQAGDENHVLEALGKVSVDLRNKVGESLSTIQKFDTPLELATTPSLEALKAFSSGVQTISTKGSDAAIPFFKHAIELDPNFALGLGRAFVLQGDTAKAKAAYQDFLALWKNADPDIPVLQRAKADLKLQWHEGPACNACMAVAQSTCSGSEGWGWRSGGALGEDERDEEHGGRGVEGCSGNVDAGADRLAEDVGEEAWAEQAGDASEAVDRALELALFGGAGLAGEKALGGGPGEGHHVE
jgi:hypothetical protein